MKIHGSQTVFALLISVFSLFNSCTGFLSEESKAENSTGQLKARLCLSVSEENCRTIAPADLSENDIVRVKLVADKNSSDGESFDWQWIKNSGKNALTMMKNDAGIFLEPGSYNFTLDLYTEDGFCQRGILSDVSVKAGDNSLVFDTKYLTDSSVRGDFRIDLTWTGSEGIGLIMAGLFTEESDGELPFLALSPIAIDGNSAFFASDAPIGTYFIRFEIYDESQSERLNVIEDVIKILSGRKTVAAISLSDINTIYKISYNLNGGEWIDPAYSPVEKRNACKIVTLPGEGQIRREGFVFAGWFESNDGGTTLTGSPITSLGAGSSGDLELYAKWTELTEIYVSETGRDDSGKGSEDLPFASLDRAISLIKNKNNSLKEYKIFVSGRLRELISLSDIPASALEISGQTASQAIIDGDLDGDGAGDGTVLSLTTDIPLTIKNLKITGGSGVNGGGIFVGSGASLSLSDGALISGNSALINGGGIYNEGSLFISGSAVIGDKDCASAADSFSHSNSAANHGGGIYNKGGKIYLGYTRGEDGSPLEDSDFTGGIYFNYAAYMGGGIYDDLGSNAEIKMAGGEISFNGAKDDGGGVRLANNDVFTMSGGKIRNNIANWDLYTNGGGAFYVGGGSTLILTGGEISGNRASLGNAIFAKSNAILKMSGSISIPAGVDGSHDVYLMTNGTIEVEAPFDAGTSTPVATVTPQPDATGSYNLGRVVLSGSAVGSEHAKFAVTKPFDNTDWSITSEGKLMQSLSAGIAISVPAYTSDDLELQATGKTSDGSKYTFRAKAAYSSYLWTVNGLVYSTSENSVQIPKSGLPLTNVLMLVAVDSEGNVHEARITFTVTD